MKRAYGSEPVLLHTSPISPLLAPSHQKKGISKKITWAVGITVLVMIISAGGWFGWRALQAPEGIPPSVRKAVRFPLYQPENMPSGFEIDQDSFNATDGLVTFSITYGNNRRMVVTEQARPDNFDFASFHDQLNNKEGLTTYIGSGAVGLFEDTDFASIVAPQTWVLVRAPSGIEPGPFAQVLQSFR